MGAAGRRGRARGPLHYLPAAVSRRLAVGEVGQAGKVLGQSNWPGPAPSSPSLPRGLASGSFFHLPALSHHAPYHFVPSSTSVAAPQTGSDYRGAPAQLPLLQGSHLLPLHGPVRDVTLGDPQPPATPSLECSLSAPPPMTTCPHPPVSFHVGSGLGLQCESPEWSREARTVSTTMGKPLSCAEPQFPPLSIRCVVSCSRSLAGQW